MRSPRRFQSRLPPDPPAANDAAVKDALALQQAMHEAKYYLQHGNDSRKAVDLLEGQLPRVNGNAEYLRLLRDAYRARIKDLYLGSQAARRRFSWSALRSGARRCHRFHAAAQPETARSSSRPSMRGTETGKRLPDFGRLFKGAARLRGAGQAQRRARRAGRRSFDARNQREMLPASARSGPGLAQLVSKADVEFKTNHYGPARTFYEQAASSIPTACRSPRTLAY